MHELTRKSKKQFLLLVFSPCDTGYPDPEVVWFKDDQSIRESRHFQIDYDEDGKGRRVTENQFVAAVCGKVSGPSDEISGIHT